MTIKKLEIEHLEAVRELAEKHGGNIVEPKKIRDYWFYQEFGLSYVAIERGDIVGFILAIQNPKDPEGLYVENILRNYRETEERIGTGLLFQAFKKGKEDGCKHAWGFVLPTNGKMFDFLREIGIENISKKTGEQIDIGERKIISPKEGEPYIKDCNGPGEDYSIVGVELTDEYLAKLKKRVKGESITF